MALHRIRSATLVLALICFCLPWIEIRCNHLEHGLIVTTQSGLQMTYGGSTTTAKGKPVSEADRTKHSQSAGDREKPVPLMILYAAGLVTALVVSLIMTGTARRWAVATLASGVAAAAMVIQLALGFPLVEGIPRGEGGWTHTIWFWLALASSMAAPLISIWERLGPATSASRAEQRPPVERGPA